MSTNENNDPRDKIELTNPENLYQKETYQYTCTANTQQLKKERSDLVQGKDLRYKSITFLV